MLFFCTTLLFNSWSTCCFHVTCCSAVDQYVVFADVQKLINCWSTCWNMSHHDKLMHTQVDQLLFNLLFLPKDSQHVEQQLINMLILSLINMLIYSWSSMEPHVDQLRWRCNPKHPHPPACILYGLLQQITHVGGTIIAWATVVRSAPSYGLALRAAFGRTQSVRNSARMSLPESQSWSTVE